MKWQSITAQVVCSLALVVLTRPALGAQQVPFKGVLEGSFIRTPSTPPLVDVLLTASGNASHLGRFTLISPHRVDPSNVTSIGTCTLIAADGDRLLTDVTGQGALIAPNVLRVVEWHTIKGGTGRFAGASGQFVVDRLIHQAAFTTVGSFQGTISAVGTSQR